MCILRLLILEKYSLRFVQSTRKIEFIVHLNAYIVDLGDNGVRTSLIYLNTF